MIEDYDSVAKELLDGHYWLPDIKLSELYFRTHDDCDGDKTQGIGITITMDGDVWIKTTKKDGYCRFRMTGGGGGNSHRVRNAILLLALAIKMENEESGK